MGSGDETMHTTKWMHQKLNITSASGFDEQLNRAGMSAACDRRAADTTGYGLSENYNNSVEKVLTLMTLYLKIVFNTDVFQHAILSSCWKFWRV